MLAEVGQFPPFFGRSSPLGPHGWAADHGGDRARRLQPRRPLGDRVRRQRLLADDLPARRRRRLRRRAETGALAVSCWSAMAATAIVLGLLRRRHAPQRPRDLRRDRRDRRCSPSSSTRLEARRGEQPRSSRRRRRRPQGQLETAEPAGPTSSSCFGSRGRGTRPGYPTADLEERVLALASRGGSRGPQISVTPTVIDLTVGSLRAQRSYTLRVRPSTVDLDASRGWTTSSRTYSTGRLGTDRRARLAGGNARRSRCDGRGRSCSPPMRSRAPR